MKGILWFNNLTGKTVGISLKPIVIMAFSATGLCCCCVDGMCWGLWDCLYFSCLVLKAPNSHTPSLHPAGMDARG